MAAAQPAWAQVTAFTYQGRLTDGPSVANGRYDLSFTLHDVELGGSSLGRVVIHGAVPVTNGVFTVPLDFGADAFDGTSRWLEVSVRTNGLTPFEVLQPRTPMQAVPQAIHALRAHGLTSRLDPSNLPAGVVRADLPNEFRHASFFMDPVAIGSFPVMVQGAGPNDDYIGFQSRTNSSTRWHLTGALGGLNVVESGVADYRLFLARGGNIGVGTATPQALLHINGTTRSKGRITADENLIVHGRLGVGTDNPAVPFELQDGDEPTPGPVEPGDLLTSSATPGHAMRLGDPAQGAGAILGKAMTRLDKGRGLVLVLVSLQ